MNADEMIVQQQQDVYRLGELGDFLCTRRARVTPEDVGLPRGNRRKTPGLRRAEVAQMVGVSVDWYTWLEQGRPIRPSTPVLERLVQVLRLDVDERNHLFLLATQQAPPALAQETETVSPALRHFLDQFGHRPAFISGRRWDVLARNDAGRIIFGDDSTRTGRERNTIWNVFIEPMSRTFIVDWEADARHLLAQFRNTIARYPGDAQLAELVHDLQERSPEFRAWWPQHDVVSGQEGRKTLNHPQAGILEFERLTFQVFDQPDLKVTVYTPVEGTDTARKIDQLMTQNSQPEGRLASLPEPVGQAQLSGDSVDLWLRACGQRVDGAWTANSAVMRSYADWCVAQGCSPKSAKALSQRLAARGLEIGVNKRVTGDQGQQKMTRGVRGLKVI